MTRAFKAPVKTGERILLWTSGCVNILHPHRHVLLTCFSEQKQPSILPLINIKIRLGLDLAAQPLKPWILKMLCDAGNNQEISLRITNQQMYI